MNDNRAAMLIFSLDVVPRSKIVDRHIKLLHVHYYQTVLQQTNSSDLGNKVLVLHSNSRFGL